jgi:hypothetical protein
MITPEEIKKQAERWYKDFLIFSLKDEPFFPREVRFGKIKASETLSNFSRISKDIRELRLKSKESVGYGYQIEFVVREDRKIGSQPFPQRIFFEKEDDYLGFIRKEKEYKEFRSTADYIANSVPGLYGWILQNPMKVIEHATAWPDLIKVCRYFVSNPRPGLYIRELPIDVHTKFIEENKGIIKDLLDFLIYEDVNKEETEFEKRFNLKYNEPLIRLRVLDGDISKRHFSGLTDLTITESEFKLLDIECKRVFILENKTNFSNIFNFLTIPGLESSISVFGKGFGLGLLKDVDWLKDKEIYYWGDIDEHGFHILSQLRSYLPQTRSLMMDFETFKRFSEYRVNGTAGNIRQLPNLTEEEDKLFKHLLGLKEKNRLEQEKISHCYIVEYIKAIIFKKAANGCV